MIFDHLNNTFNNREIALIFYFFLFLLWALTQPKIRESFLTLIKAFFVWRIQVSVFILLVYVTLIIYLLYLLNFWDTFLIKDTIYWTFGVGFILMFSSDKAMKEEHYFIFLIRDNFRFLVIIEFIVGLYVFSLVIEFILMPIVIFFLMLLGYAEVYKEYRQIKNILQTILSIAGISYLSYSLFHIYQDFNHFATYNTLITFLFPIIMTSLFIPFAYFYALVTQYELLFIRVGLSIKEDEKLCRYAKWRLLTSVNFSLYKIKKITPGLLFGGCKTKKEIRNEIANKLNAQQN